MGDYYDVNEACSELYIRKPLPQNVPHLANRGNVDPKSCEFVCEKPSLKESLTFLARKRHTVNPPVAISSFKIGRGYSVSIYRYTYYAR